MSAPEFFVGYIPMPRRHARVASSLAAVLVIGAVGLAGLLALAQSNPGGGKWDQSGAGRFEGVLRVDPYPRLVTADEHGSAMEAVLVDPGKIGATGRASGFAGQSVVVRGGLIRWGARAVIELAATPDDIVKVGEGAAPPPAGAMDRVALIGEIVDPKCYLGVMNPGFGKPHLSCAELCIKGGIPPVLVVRGASGTSGGPIEGQCYLLTTPEGSAANDTVRGWVGRSVRVVGVRRDTPNGWGFIAAESIEAAR